eukprot:c27739_g2_i2 orf=662-1198(-)
MKMWRSAGRRLVPLLSFPPSFLSTTRAWQFQQRCQPVTNVLRFLPSSVKVDCSRLSSSTVSIVCAAFFVLRNKNQNKRSLQRNPNPGLPWLWRNQGREEASLSLSLSYYAMPNDFVYAAAPFLRREHLSDSTTSVPSPSYLHASATEGVQSAHYALQLTKAFFAAEQDQQVAIGSGVH